MDKSRFVEIAPIYYALAIAITLKGNLWDKPMSEVEILARFTVPDGSGDPESGYCYLSREILFQKAVRWLSEKALIETVEDEFGPPIYAVLNQWTEAYEELKKDRNLPFFKYSSLSDGASWLREALSTLDRTYAELNIQDSDFDNPNEEWLPLPLDRDDPRLQAAIRALDDTIEHVRADNGYNVNLPGERNYVLEGLTNVSRTLKEASFTSAPYIRKYALEPLALLMRRFKDAAISIIASAAKDTLIDYLKTHAPLWLGTFFS